MLGRLASLWIDLSCFTLCNDLRRDNKDNSRSNKQLMISALCGTGVNRLVYLLACLSWKALILPKPAWRENGSTAKVTRSQFFIPKAIPANPNVIYYYLMDTDGA